MVDHIIDALNVPVVRGLIEAGIGGLLAFPMYYVGQLMKGLPKELHTQIQNVNAAIAVLLAVVVYSWAQQFILGMNVAELVSAFAIGGWGSKIVNDNKKPKSLPK